MIVLDLTETNFQRRCSNSLPFLKRRFLSTFKYFQFSIFNKNNKSTIIIGDLRNLTQLIVAIFFKKIIVVDDGMVTLSIINSKENLFWVRNILKRKLIYFILIKISHKIEYHSIFVEKKFYNKFLKISFYPLNLNVRDYNFKLKNGTVFLGMDLVECKILNKSKYKKILQLLVKKYGCLFYYPHRKETNKWKIKNLIYLERKDNIEDYVIGNGYFQNHISFYSTSLIILKRLKVGGRIAMVVLKSDEIINFREHIKNSYEFLKKFNVEEESI